MKKLKERLQNLDLGWALVLLLVCACCAAGGAVFMRHYDRHHLALQQAEAPEPPRWEARHVHTWGKWEFPFYYSRTVLGGYYRQERQCTECGWAEHRRIPEPQ